MQVGIPEAGYYKRKFGKGGVWIPVRWWLGPPHDPLTGEVMDRSPRWQATVNGKQADPYETWISCAGHPITEAEYNYMMGVAKWAAEHAPDAPEAKPGEKVDLNKRRPLF